MSAYIDKGDATDLGNGYTLAWVVDDEGGRWPWLTHNLCADCAEQADDGCCCRVCAPHEQTGALPRPWRERIGVLQRCGASTHSGRPCRVLVRPGARCWMHGGGSS